VLFVGLGIAIAFAIQPVDPPAVDKSASSPSASSPSASGTATAGNTAASNQGTNPGGPPPSLCPTQATRTSTAPALCVSQPLGDGYSVFVVHGTGFQPFGQITVELSGIGVSPDHPTADMQGTFNYAIDQGHLFFLGPMPPGTYRVVATEAGGRSATVTFQVNQGANGAPPPGSP
jgi:hypothetical protein